MYNFNFYMPTKVLFDPGKLNELHTEQLPGKKALIVTTNGQSVIKYGYLDRVKKELDIANIEYAIFAGIRPNPTDLNVMDGAKAVKENGCDFVIALGGGSVMDCTKCIALMASNPGNIWDYSLSANGGKKNAEYPAIPIVCITTSAGTASEVDIASVITNDTTQEKTGIFFPSMFPTLSVVDSDLMMSVPPKFTAYQGMGIDNPASGKDFIKALDKLIADVGCADLKMSEEGITEDELKLYPAKVHEVLGGNITADPLPLSDADYLEIFQKAYC